MESEGGPKEQRGVDSRSILPNGYVVNHQMIRWRIDQNPSAAFAHLLAGFKHTIPACCILCTPAPRTSRLKPSAYSWARRAICRWCQVQCNAGIWEGEGGAAKLLMGSEKAVRLFNLSRKAGEGSWQGMIGRQEGF